MPPINFEEDKKTVICFLQQLLQSIEKIDNPDELFFDFSFEFEHEDVEVYGQKLMHHTGWTNVKFNSRFLNPHFPKRQYSSISGDKNEKNSDKNKKRID